MTDETFLKLKENALYELVRHILPFWIEKMADNTFGGFYGQINGNNLLIETAPKGGILNARILWTFSSAYNTLKDPVYLQFAEYTAGYIFNHFFDEEKGGTFWSLNFKGEPLDTKKQIYSQAFFIYALVEYHIATGKQHALDLAVSLFNLIENHSFDEEMNGYLEAFDQNWELLDDLRLSAKDANEKKTMNTHLHVLEAYTSLYRVWKDPQLASRLGNLINLFLDKFIDPVSSHLNLFYDEQWVCRSTITSFGHDIECSWLLYEAALALNNKELTAKVRLKCLELANAVNEGLQDDGSLIYEKNNITGHKDADRHWWPQAEAVVGNLNAWELTGDETLFRKASRCFQYIETHLIDPLNGEWYWSIRSDGTINRQDDKAGFWKCPYHNSRMCLEVINRYNKLTGHLPATLPK